MSMHVAMKQVRLCVALLTHLLLLLLFARSLGDLDFKEPHRFVECDPDVKRLLLQPKRDTFVVLASDGLWDVLSDTDAVITTATALKVMRAQHGADGMHAQPL